ncbi:uncharacterized protein HaLaN_22742, partial [Haematococcus lacustris]
MRRARLPVALLLVWMGCSAISFTAGCSDYCSRGKVKTMRGDIANPAGLRELINSTAFNSELIFTIMTDDISYAVPVVHMHLNMLKLGFEHFFLLSQSEAGCTNLYSAYEGVMPLPTCVWDSFMPPPKTFNVLELLWHHKHRMLLRLTRLGVNVLYMDSDTMLFDNPYKYLKAPGPFADVRYLGTVETTTGIQASFFYMQNVAPDGPISWMMWDVVEMGLRWQDDNRTLISSWGVQKPEEATMMSFDQNYWDDAFLTSMFGQEVRPCIVNALYGDKMVINNKNTGREQVDLQLSHYRSYKRQGKDMFTRTLVLHPDGPVRPPAHSPGLTDEPIGFWDVMASFQLVSKGGVRRGCCCVTMIHQHVAFTSVLRCACCCLSCGTDAIGLMAAWPSLACGVVPAAATMLYRWARGSRAVA